MDDLGGKVAVVTGAASGIGRALAHRWAEAGMRVVLADVEDGPLASVTAELVDSGADAHPVGCDVSDPDQVEAVAITAVDRFGAIHVACNNAGVATGGLSWELTREDWDWVLGVNLWGVIYGITSFVPRIIEAGGGHVVNTASVAGLTSPPLMGPYNVSKHGVVTLSETLSRELRLSGHPVGVSVLCPGFVNTRIHESGRNRPGHVVEVADAELAASVMAPMIQSGLDPGFVAGRVHDAVLADEFYILTHREMDPMIESRNAAIVDHGHLD